MVVYGDSTVQTSSREDNNTMYAKWKSYRPQRRKLRQQQQVVMEEEEQQVQIRVSLVTFNMLHSNRLLSPSIFTYAAS